MPRVIGIAVALGLLATACSSPSNHLPLTRAAGADSVAQPNVTTQLQPATPTASLGPLDQHLVPDVLVRLRAPLQAGQAQQLAGLVPPGRAVTLRTGTVKLAGPTAGGDISAAGVDPAAFRRFTPQNT